MTQYHQRLQAKRRELEQRRQAELRELERRREEEAKRRLEVNLMELQVRCQEEEWKARQELCCLEDRLHAEVCKLGALADRCQSYEERNQYVHKQALLKCQIEEEQKKCECRIADKLRRCVEDEQRLRREYEEKLGHRCEIEQLRMENVDLRYLLEASENLWAEACAANSWNRF
jgi:hypothetical protein